MRNGRDAITRVSVILIKRLAMEKDLQSTEALEKLKELVKSVDICMYCNTDTSGDMLCRPMSTVRIEAEGALCFSPTDHSGLAPEAARKATVCLTYSHPGKHTSLSVTGHS